MEGEIWRPSGYPAAYPIILHESTFCFNYQEEVNRSIHELPRRGILENPTSPTA
jgi:hypothetical protein